MKKSIVFIVLLFALQNLFAEQSNLQMETDVEEPTSFPDFQITVKAKDAIIDTEFYNRFQATTDILLLYPEVESERSDMITDLSYNLPIGTLDLIYDHLTKMGIECEKYIVPYDSWYRQSSLYIGYPTIRDTERYLKYLAGQNQITYSSLVIIPKTYKLITAFGPAMYNVHFEIIDIYQNYQWENDFKVKLAQIKHSRYGRQDKIVPASKDGLDKLFPTTYDYNPNYPFVRVGNTANWSEDDFKLYGEENGLLIFEGLYQRDRQHYYVKKYADGYVVVACGKGSRFLDGDIRGVMEETATRNIFMGDWNPYDKYDVYKSCTFIFDQVGLMLQAKGMENPIELVKIWPKASNVEIPTKSWSGSGWSINKGYVITNHHVTDGAKTISVNHHGTKSQAKLVASDKDLDLAVLYVEDLKEVIPSYGVRSGQCSVGESCFVLGYPLTDALGKEIKLTNGIISARSGYQGANIQYQISAPVQPGNSGCPMFDEDGDVAGVINSGIPSADNVGYAIKLGYLRTFLENLELDQYLPSGKTVKQLSTLPQKVDAIKDYIYFIECEGK